MMRLSRLSWCTAALPTVVTGATSLAIYDKIIHPATMTSELATLANELRPHLSDPWMTTLHKLNVAQTLLSRSTRNEPVLQQCMWDIFKKPLPTSGRENDDSDLEEIRQLAIITSVAFHLMARAGFTNDHQMSVLAIGRCVELSHAMSLFGVAEAYSGLKSLNTGYLSLTQVGLYDSDVTADGTLRDLSSDVRPTLAELSNQPNLIDIVCSELENRVLQLAAVEESDSNMAPSDSAKEENLQLVLGIVDSLASVGALSPLLFGALQAIVARNRLASLPVGYVASTIGHILQIQERIIDPLNHADDVEFTEARGELVRFLTSHISAEGCKPKELQKHPLTVLQLRRLFEKHPALADHSPALWDAVRCVRVAHRHSLSPSPVQLEGSLPAKLYPCKPKRISEDLSEAERFVPPPFKTWRSPQHSPRGRHKPFQRQPRVSAFGRQRIAKDYIRKKRMKYCPSVS